MYRGIIGLVDGDPDGEISRNRGGTNIEGERIENFGDGSLVTGSASGTTEKQRDVPIVGDEYITSEREDYYPEVYVEFLADLPSGWVTVSSSDGTFLWKFLEAKHHVTIARAEIDISALTADVKSWDSTEVWQSQTAWGDPEDAASENGVTISYHNDASWPSGDRAGQLGFRALWDGGPIRGTIAKSGYVALFNAEEETAGKFISDVVLPHCSVPDSEQTTLSAEEMVDQEGETT